MIRDTISLVTLSLFTSVVGACGTQADSNYQGEKLITVTGTVTNDLPSPPQAEVTIFWSYDTGAGDLTSFETAEVTGSFPASFTLDLYTPPPLSDDAPIALGYIVAIDPDTFDPENPNPRDGILGAAERHMLLYMGQDFADFTPDLQGRLIDFLGEPVDAGYYVLDVLPDGGGGVFRDAVRVADDNEVNVRMAPFDELDFPEVS